MPLAGLKRKVDAWENRPGEAIDVPAGVMHIALA
jgi:hypothetical protein